jgi:CDP-2,3-bis-(O-geranylgeranyl)-sn-glycerol synthase
VTPGLVARALWLAAPATLACVLHMVVVKRGIAPRLAVPLDGGRSFRGRPLFGANKTWRGVLVVVAGTAILGGLQGGLLGAWAERLGLGLVDYRAASLGLPGPAPLLLALGYALVNAALGAAYVAGELPNSFLKRRLDVDPGERPAGRWRALFFVLDQCDSATAAMVVCAVGFSLPWRDVVPATLTLAGVHAGVTALLHAARLKRSV